MIVRKHTIHSHESTYILAQIPKLYCVQYSTAFCRMLLLPLLQILKQLRSNRLPIHFNTEPGTMAYLFNCNTNRLARVVCFVA